MLDVFRYLLYTSYDYAGIMLDAFRYLLCSKLCWHNRPKPSLNALIECLIGYVNLPVTDPKTMLRILLFYTELLDI